LLKDDRKLAGKTKIKKLLKDGKPPAILNVKERDLPRFSQEAKKYGILFSAIKDKTDKSGKLDIIARQEDIPKINRIFEKIGYDIPEELKKKTTAGIYPTEKTEKAQPGLEKGLTAQENGLTVAETEITNTDKTPVKSRVEAIKAAARQTAKDAAEQSKEKSNAERII
jgi:hypothetical protein